MEWWVGGLLLVVPVGVVITVTALAWRRGHPSRGPNRVALVERMPIEYITPEFVRHEDNAEVRAVLLRRLGIERWSKMVGMERAYSKSDDWGTIYEDPNRRYRAVVVKNSTPSPDGTFKEYWLRVPAERDRQPPRFCRLCGIRITGNITSGRQAVAWTFGLCTTHYAPVTVS